jgi:hypothetical protein
MSFFKMNRCSGLPIDSKNMVCQKKATDHSDVWNTSREEVDWHVELRNRNVFCIEEERYDAETFLPFVLERYPTGKMAMILDNTRIHHA